MFNLPINSDYSNTLIQFLFWLYNIEMAEASEVTSTEFEDEPKKEDQPQAPVDATHQGNSKLNANFY